MPDNIFPYALARKWLGDYSEHVFFSIALRDLIQRGACRGAIRGPMTARAVALLETTDQLASFELRPSLRLAGVEADFWIQTVRYASQVSWMTPPGGLHVDDLTSDLVRMNAAWEQFETFVGELPAYFYEMSVALTAGAGLRGESLVKLFGPRFGAAAAECRHDFSSPIGPNAIV